MMKKITLLAIAILCFIRIGYAQDPQFSQYYANPIYTNPAFAGSDGDIRFNLNYRNQWPVAEVNFVTYTFSADYYIEDIDSGIGLIYVNDVATESKFRSQKIGLQYAYEAGLTDTWNLRFGLEGSYVSRDINYSDLVFGDQWSSASRSFSNPTGETLADNVNNYLDVAAGALLYSEHYWAGVSIKHLTRPNQDFLELQQNLGSANSRLPISYSLQLGARFLLQKYHWRDKYRHAGHFERDITFAANYRRQGSFNQLDVGAYITYPPIVFGVWYRGIPFNNVEIGIPNHEAVVGLLGFKIGDLTIGYSYDFTISRLDNSNTGGAHELSLSLGIIPRYGSGHRTHKHRSIPCPSF